MIDRRAFKEIDWILIGLLILNSVIGVVIIYSASHHLSGNYCLRQIFWVLGGLAVLFLILAVDYKILCTYSPYLYVVLVSVLAGMLIFAKLIAGTKSWIRFKFFQVQPSEIIKIIIILLLSQIFSEFKRNFLTSNGGALSAALVGLPVFLIAFQPDLGTALSLLPILLAALLLAGLRRKSIIILLLVTLVIGVAGWNFYLKDYQKKRLTTLVSPGQDPQGSGYHILQSKIAIGSGGFLGKGFKKGTQSQLKFLPARHTDFVFSVIGEEFGFVGVLGVIMIYFLFLRRIFLSIGKSRDRAGVYIIFMVGMMITFQFFVNVLMVAGLFPVAGVPLPLISYGGSSLLANFLGVALVLNVKMRRFANA
jgi:rod shape determining protein RodA